MIDKRKILRKKGSERPNDMLLGLAMDFTEMMPSFLALLLVLMRL